MNHKPKAQVGMSVGFISLLIIFIVLCLITFAILALTTANADYALTQKNIDYSNRFYSANNSSQTKISQLDAILIQARQTSADDNAYWNTLTESLKGNANYTFDPSRRTVTLKDEISQTSFLQTELLIHEMGTEQRYSLLSAHVNTTPLPIQIQQESFWDGE